MALITVLSAIVAVALGAPAQAAAAPSTDRLGLPFSNARIEAPFAAAIDPVSGGLFVADAEQNGLVLRGFTANGLELGPPLAGVSGIAVDPLPNSPTPVWFLNSSASATFIQPVNPFTMRALGSPRTTGGPALDGSVALARRAQDGVLLTYVSHPDEGLGEGPESVSLSDGNGVTTIGSRGTGNGQFIHPFGVAVAPDGDLFVADYGNGRVVRFHGDGGFVANLVPDFVGPVAPLGIAVGRDGDSLYIADSNRIVVMSISGAFAAGSFGVDGTAASAFQLAGGVSTDCRGRVIVADSGSREVGFYGTPGTAPPPCVAPTLTDAAVAVTGPDRAQLVARIDPAGDPTTYRVEYGRDTSYGAMTPPRSAGSGVIPSRVLVDVDGLEPATTYHARIQAESAFGVVASVDLSFSTAPGPGLEPTSAPAPRRTALRCTIPKLRGLRIAAARIALQRGGCRLGRVNRPHRLRSSRARRLVVASQSIAPGTSRPVGTGVSVTMRVKRCCQRLKTDPLSPVESGPTSTAGPRRSPSRAGVARRPGRRPGFNPRR